MQALAAKYDAAVNTAENAKHWAASDGLGPAAMADSHTRQVLRQRARYEVLQNSSCGRGMVLKKVRDLIGRGPQLHLQLDRVSATAGRQSAKQASLEVQALFDQWAKQVNLANLLSTAVSSYITDGESFLVATTDDRQPEVQLGLALYEGDQVAAPNWSPGVPTASYDDGITYNAQGYPVSYDLLLSHPGSDNAIGWVAGADYRRIPSAQVAHLFRADRPGQRRGIPHLAPALPLFAMRRRFLLATVSAAELSADFAAVIQTGATAYTQPAEVDPFSQVEIDRGMMVSMPEGWQMSQLRPEHPTSTFDAFDKALVAEVCRCLDMPYAVAAGSHEGFTYASGKLDKDSYLTSLEAEQAQISMVVLDKVLGWWLAEAAMLPGYLPAFVRQRVQNSATLPHSWYWEKKREADPLKQAQADKTYHELGLLTDVEFWTARGLDPGEQYAELQKQILIRKEIGANEQASSQSEVIEDDQEETSEAGGDD
jgi:capsid protein